ncbi:unnamed protein product [Urochloa decumbens]|uniref:Uncharacterized protein n=1 Tax=Urochloa decumbens TaxID=240449 RepID=A0ABC8ZCE1_9POAL
MADHSDGSSAASNSPPPALADPGVITEEDVRSLFDGEGGWGAGYWPYMMGTMGTEDDEMFVQLGSLDRPAVLENMLAAGRWVDVSGYLQRALEFHRDEAQAAVAYPEGDNVPAPTDMPRAHPELFVLPRRMHALELLGSDNLEEAQHYFNLDIFGPTRAANRTLYLDNLITELQNMIFNEGPAAQPLDLPGERRRTAQHIQDYLRVNFPTLDRGPEAAASMATSKRQLYTTWRFGEHIDDYNYRCLVCHQTIPFNTAPDHRMVEHLHADCPAMTPGVRRRLPRPNRPPRPAQPPPPPAAADDDDADPEQQEADDD